MFTPALILVRILYGLASAFYAKKRKLNPYFWFFLGLFLDVLALLAIFFISRKKKKVEVEPAIAIPSSVTQTESTTLWYYLDMAHAQTGPVSEKYLQDLYQDHTISAETYIWSEDLTDWKKYKEIFVPKEPLSTK